MRNVLIGAIVVGCVIAGGWWWQQRSVSAEIPPSNLIASLSGEADANFARATIPDNIEFPRDLGAHDEYQTEWWYYTGNLQADDGREFGFQYTIFRRALAATDDQVSAETDPSQWRTTQVYLVHFTISDIANQAFYHTERYSRAGAQLAGAQAQPYRVWVEDMQIAEQADGRVRLIAAASSDGTPYALDLTLTQTLAPILHGDGGLSAKSLEPGNASYYYSQVQQIADGTVTIDGTAIPVTGKAWTDHEYSTSVLSEGALGWDWFSLQFDDGAALMLFQIRQQDGAIEAASSGTFIYPDGSTVDISVDDWQLSVENRWKSPVTNANYPVAWRLDIDKIGLTLTGQAKMDNQELTVSAGSYWEGAVEFSGQRDGTAVSAEGYIEMTGYADASSSEQH